MSADLSVRNPNQAAILMADALLRGMGGTAASLLVAPATGDTSDAAQLGLNAPNFQQLPLSPAVFRRVQAHLSEGETAQYELLISAAAVELQVSAAQLTSADELFDSSAGVMVNGMLLLIEARSASTTLGDVYLYRLLLRESSALEQPLS